MPTITLSDGRGVCPACGERLTGLHFEFDPFPGEHSGLYESQETIGCPKCGWQQIKSHYEEYDPYNPNRPKSKPRVFDKKSFER